MDFTSHVERIAGTAVKLVNALTPGQARGRDFAEPAGDEMRAAVSEALRADGEQPPAVSALDAADLAVVAARLREVFALVEEGDVDAAAMSVNALLAETGAHPQLDRHDSEPWHLHFHADSDSLARGWAAGCATGLAIVLGTEMYDRLGVCTAPRCDRVYIDGSRNATRRFCSTSCQNRVKAAAFRARR